MKIKCLFLKTLFIVVLLAPPCSRISAQPVYSSSQVLPFISSNSIAKEYVDKSVVSCFHNDDGAGSVFNLTDSFFSVTTMHLHDVIVNDFVIDNGSVYFCGRTSDMRYGVIGIFDIDSLFYGSHNYSTYRFFCDYSADTARNLLHLVSYLDNYGRRHVVAAGDHEETCFLVDFYPTSQNLDYISWRPVCTSEDVHGLALSDNNVVLLTINRDTASLFLNMRAFDYDVPIPAVLINKYRHLFKNSSFSTMIDKGACITALTGMNSVAVMSYYSRPTGAVNSYYIVDEFTQVAEFDAYSLTQSVPCSMLNAVDITHITEYASLYPRQIIWEPINSNFVLLHGLLDINLLNASSPAESNSFYALPYSSMSFSFLAVDANYIPMTILNSVSNFLETQSPYYCYFVNGIRNQSDAVYSFNSYTSTSACVESYPLSSSAGVTTASEVIEDKSMTRVDKVIKTISTAEPWNTVLNIECSSNQTK